MISNYSQYYNILKKVSSLPGQWPYQTLATRLFCLTVITVSIVSIIIPQIVHFVKCKNTQCIFEAMTSCSLSFTTVVKVYTCYLSRFKLKMLIDHFFIECDKPRETPEEYEIMKRYAKQSMRFSMVYSLYCCISMCVFMCVPLVPKLLDVLIPLNESRPIVLPYPGYYFVDESKYFRYIFCHSIVAWEMAVIGIVAHDCLFVSCVEHVCSIFAVAGFQFERSTYENAKRMKASSARSSNCYKDIVFSVYVHRKALKLAQFLEDIFSYSFVLQLIINTIAISIALLQIMRRDVKVLEGMRYILYFVALLIHLFFLSFEGQKLIDHSLQMRNKMYNGSWYKLPMKPQKLLLFVMMKSIRPCYVSASKIYIFSLEGFSSIVQTSMSYFTVLTSFQ